MATEADLYALAPDNVFKPVTAINPLAVAGSFSATISGFDPNGEVGAPLTATAASSNTALPNGEVVVVSNTGTAVAYLRLGDVGVTAATGDLPLEPSSQIGLTVGANSYVAAVTSSGTTTINTTGGAGLFSSTSAGGGSGGGSLPGFSSDGSGPTVAILTNDINMVAGDATYFQNQNGDVGFYNTVGLLTLDHVSGALYLGDFSAAGDNANDMDILGTYRINNTSIVPSEDGQILIGSTGTVPALATITAGAGVTITNGPGSIEIAVTGGGGAVSGGPVLSATVEITQEQLTELGTTPVSLGVTVPGGSKLVPTEVTYERVEGTSEAGGADLKFALLYDSGAPIAFAPSATAVNTASFDNATPVSIDPTALGATTVPTGVGLSVTSISNSGTRMDLGVWGSITSLAVNNGGGGWVVGDQFTVEGGDGAATGQVDTQSPPAFNAAVTGAVAFAGNDITGVDQGLQTFSVGVDLTSSLAVGAIFRVLFSSGNDGNYTVAGAVFGAGTTTITVVEAIPDPTVDGKVDTFGALSVAGDHTADIVAGGYVTVRGSTGNDGYAFNVAVVSFAGGQTTAYVGPASDAVQSSVADGALYQTGAATAVSLVLGGQSYSSDTGVSVSPLQPSAGGNLLVDTTVSAPATGTATVTVLYQVLPYVPVPSVPVAGVGIVPGPTYDQVGATQLGYGINMLEPAFTNFGSVQLPAAAAGAVVELGIQATSTLTAVLYAKYGTSDQINACGSNAAAFDAYFGMPGVYNPAPFVRCVCVTDGAWVCNVALD